MSQINLFNEEESIISLAKSLLNSEDHRAAQLYPHFERLLESYIKLNSQLKRIIKLSDKQHNRLSVLNSAMKHILDHIPVGIVIIDANGLIQPAYSQYMNQLFFCEDKLVQKPIETVLYWEDHKEKDRNTFKSWLSLVFDLSHDWDLIRDLGPDVIRHESERGSLYYKNAYHRVIHKNKEVYLIIHITDISEEMRQKIALDEQETAHHFEVEILSCIVDHEYSTEIIDFISDTERLIEDSLFVFSTLADSKDRLPIYNHLYRLMHSIKGLSGAYGIKEFVRLSNQAEDILTLYRNNEITFETGMVNEMLGSSRLEMIIEKMSAFLKNAEEIIRKIFHQGKETSAAIRKKRRGLKVDTDVFNGIISRMAALSDKAKHSQSELSHDLNSLLSSINSLTLQPIDVVFNRLRQIVKDVSFSLQKQVAFHTEGDRILLCPDSHHMIITALIHMLRNALDHGIEPPEERELAKKDPCGHIHLKTAKANGTITIEMSDDGQGIDPERVARKVVELGLVPEERLHGMTESEIINLILLPGFTSKGEVTELSGRGVGMDAVVDSMKSLNGNMAVSSKIGQGVTVTLSFPEE